jgi:CheY-like chemotaxis protein
MLSCTKRANNIIDIILSNIRNEKIDNFTSEILSVNILINQAIKEYGYQNEEERKKIKLELGEDFIFKGERSSFIYVLFNLIRNALYYIETYPNSIITIKTIKANQQALYHKVIVRDTGPGISQNKIESLFKAFNTFDKSGGTGLGLNFVYNTMKALHGNVECNSKLGEFTEFILNLPICNKNNEVTEKLPIDIEVVDNDFAGKTILIIDDDMLHRILVRRILENSFNLKVIEANNGEAALKILKNKEKIDLIFTDINMPVMDGYEFTQAIRSNSEFADYQHVQIIALTSDDNLETINKIQNNGINETLTKGFDKNNLSDVLYKTLKKSGFK